MVDAQEPDLVLTATCALHLAVAVVGKRFDPVLLMTRRAFSISPRAIAHVVVVLIPRICFR